MRRRKNAWRTRVCVSACVGCRYIGKWHLTGSFRKVPHGFATCSQRHGFSYWKAGLTHRYKHSVYFNASCEPEQLTWEDFDAIAQTRDAVRYLEAHAHAERPFFLWMSYGPPHPPYDKVPPKYRRRYTADAVQLRANVPPEARNTARTDLANYYAQCSLLDDCIGDVLRTLWRTGLANNTIVVFTSDHGDMLYSHGQQRKQLPYDEATRVPLLLRMPGVAPRRIDDVVFALEDLMPTLLGLGGLRVPAPVEGTDFSSHVREPHPTRAPRGADATLLQVVTPRGQFFEIEHLRAYRGVRTTRHTYVRDADGPWLLFDNERDPLQTCNLVGNASHAELQSRLERRLQQLLRDAGDDIGFQHNRYYSKLASCLDGGAANVSSRRPVTLSQIRAGGTNSSRCVAPNR